MRPLAMVELDPQTLDPKRRALPLRPKRPDSPPVGDDVGRFASARGAWASQALARLLHAHGRRAHPGAVEEAGERRRQRGVGVERPVEIGRGLAVEGDPALRHRHDPVRRGEAALEPVLGEDRSVVPHSSLRRRRRPISSSPATGSSCEVGSSRRMTRGPADQRGGKGDALKLAARERLAVERPRRCAMPRARLASSTARAREAAGSPAISSGSSSSPRTVAATTCVSGSCATSPTSPRRSAGPWSRRSSPQTDAGAGCLASVEVREPGRTRREGASTCPRPSGQQGRRTRLRRSGGSRRAAREPARPGSGTRSPRSGDRLAHRLRPLPDRGRSPQARAARARARCPAAPSSDLDHRDRTHTRRRPWRAHATLIARRAGGEPETQRPRASEELAAPLPGRGAP